MMSCTTRWVCFGWCRPSTARRGRWPELLSESRMREIRTSGSMSGRWKRGTGRYSGTGIPKGPATRMASLHHRATSRLYTLQGVPPNQIARIGQDVEVRDDARRPLRQRQSHKSRADEPSAAGDEHVLHFISLQPLFRRLEYLCCRPEK